MIVDRLHQVPIDQRHLPLIAIGGGAAILLVLLVLIAVVLST